MCCESCRQVWQSTEVLEQGGDLPETQGLGLEKRRWLLRELKQIMAVCAGRCSTV